MTTIDKNLIGTEVQIDTGFVRSATIMEDDDGLYFYVHSCCHNGTDYLSYERPYEEKIIVAA